MITLSLHSNRLSSLPDELLDSLVELADIDIGFNRLQSSLSSRIFQGAQSLQRLYVPGNDIPFIDDDLLLSLPELE